jgi:hypothetical protein
MLAHADPLLLLSTLVDILALYFIIHTCGYTGPLLSMDDKSKGSTCARIFTSMDDKSKGSACASISTSVDNKSKGESYDPLSA